MSGDFASEPDGWDIETLEFRAPGFAQVALAGRLGTGGEGISFAGRTKVEAHDPRALLAWLTDRADAQTITAASMRVEGDVRFASDTIAIERLKAELDRMTLEGRLAYWWANEHRSARIEAVLSAPEIDLDRARTLAQGLFVGTTFDMPREGLVSAKIGRAVLAGVEASRADVSVRFNGEGLQVERLAVGDFGGAALAVKGSIDTRGKAPRGTLNLELDAKKLDGLTTVVEKISLPAAAELRRNAARLAPAKLAASLTVGATTAAAESSAGSGSTAAPAASASGCTATSGRAARTSPSPIGRRCGRPQSISVAGSRPRDGGALISLLGLGRSVRRRQARRSHRPRLRADRSTATWCSTAGSWPAVSM